MLFLGVSDRFDPVFKLLRKKMNVHLKCSNFDDIEWETTDDLKVDVLGLSVTDYSSSIPPVSSHVTAFEGLIVNIMKMYYLSIINRVAHYRQRTDH